MVFAINAQRPNGRLDRHQPPAEHLNAPPDQRPLASPLWRPQPTDQPDLHRPQTTARHAPVATSCTGNSATATALATARAINGVDFDGTAAITVTAAAGTLAMTGNANLTLNTLNVAQATLGNADPAPDAMIIGEPMIASLGTAAGQAGAGATPSGIAMTAGLGTVTVIPSQQVSLTGIPAEVRLSSAFNILIHVDVQVTGFGLTMNEGSANALIWNEVNTGSAPITPPGWQEVAA